MPTTAYVSRVVTTISLVWAEEYPDLFTKSLQRFFKEYENGFHLTTDLTHKGFIDLIAVKKEEE